MRTTIATETRFPASVAVGALPEVMYGVLVRQTPALSLACSYRVTLISHGNSFLRRAIAWTLTTFGLLQSYNHLRLDLNPFATPYSPSLATTSRAHPAMQSLAMLAAQLQLQFKILQIVPLDQLSFIFLFQTYLASKDKQEIREWSLTDIESMAANFIARNENIVWAQSSEAILHCLHEKLCMLLHVLCNICIVVKIPSHTTSVKLAFPSSVTPGQEQQALFDFSKDLVRGLHLLAQTQARCSSRNNVLMDRVTSSWSSLLLPEGQRFSACQTPHPLPRSTRGIR